MTSGTRYFFVRPFKTEPGAPMVETRLPFPCIEVMTGLALGRKLAMVGIVMTGSTTSRESEIGSARIFDDNPLPRSGSDIFGFVTVSAACVSVSSFERVSCRTVVELINRKAPVDQVEVPAIMLTVAFGTASATLVCSNQGWMQAAACFETAADLKMTGKTVKLRRPSSRDMAFRALPRASQSRVGAGKVSRRDLCGPAGGDPAQE